MPTIDDLTVLTAMLTDPDVAIIYVGVPGDVDPDRQMTVADFATLVAGELSLPDAGDVPYSNATSGLTATDVQVAIDEVAALADDALPKAGGTVTGEVIVSGTQVRTDVPAAIGTTGTLAIAFTGAMLRTTGTLTGAIEFTGSAYAAGRSVTVRVVNGGTLRTLTFPADWVFVGPKPDEIAANKTGVLSLVSFGTTAADVVAGWAVEQ